MTLESNLKLVLMSVRIPRNLREAFWEDVLRPHLFEYFSLKESPLFLLPIRKPGGGGGGGIPISLHLC